MSSTKARKELRGVSGGFLRWGFIACTINIIITVMGEKSKTITEKRGRSWPTDPTDKAMLCAQSNMLYAKEVHENLWWLIPVAYLQDVVPNR